MSLKIFDMEKSKLKLKLKIRDFDEIGYVKLALFYAILNYSIPLVDIFVRTVMLLGR